MRLKNLFICLFLAISNLFAKFQDVTWCFLHLRSTWCFSISWTEIILLKTTLRIWIWCMVVFVVSWCSSAELSNGWSHYWKHPRISRFNCRFIHINTDSMSMKQLLAMLPLNKILLDHQISYFEVESNLFAILSKLCSSSEEFLKNMFDRIRVSATHRCNRRNAERLYFVHKQLIYLSPLKLIETTNGFLWSLIDSNLPIHICQKVIIHNYKHRMEAKSLCITSSFDAFIVWITASLSFVEY